MSWYLTKIVYRIICGQGNHTAQFDEQLRLIEADNSQEAFEKLQHWAKKKKINFSMKNRNWCNGSSSMWLNYIN
ncbi:MAG: DUF4288 domain-containing protein [Puia sp.]